MVRLSLGAWLLACAAGFGCSTRRWPRGVALTAAKTGGRAGGRAGGAGDGAPVPPRPAAPPVYVSAPPPFPALRKFLVDGFESELTWLGVNIWLSPLKLALLPLEVFLFPVKLVLFPKAAAWDVAKFIVLLSVISSAALAGIGTAVAGASVIGSALAIFVYATR
ncbi:hypothetical protein M885DRAFT_567495 [Pelagophyceae sp. CCMP2097]|nr:hypothetical protein M885DRAFT_567495 [Pelagophyceae sp. CCMP2097]